jgi:hypothetical protein
LQGAAQRAAARRNGAGADVDRAAAQSGQDTVLARKCVEHEVAVRDPKVTTKSAGAAASRAVRAGRAPAATNGSILAGVRL